MVVIVVITTIIDRGNGIVVMIVITANGHMSL